LARVNETETVIQAPARGARIGAYAVFTATAALWTFSVTFGWLSRDLSASGSWGLGGITAGMLFSLAVLTFPVCGVVIAARDPANRIGRLLLLIGASWAVGSLTTYSDYGLRLHPGSLPGAAYAAALGSTFWVPAIGLTGTILLLVFPDGRLPSPRWRPVAVTASAAIAVGLLSQVLSPGTMRDAGYPHTQNPLGIGAFHHAVWVSDISLLVLLGTMLAGAAGVVVRFRRSAGVERLQMTWLAAAGAAVVAVYAVVAPLSVVVDTRPGHTPAWLNALQVLALLSFGLIPTAIGAAVLRHRLYDIDVIVRRTLAYAVLVALLAAIYLGGVALLGAGSRRLTGQSGTIAVTLSTLAVALAFQPLRGRTLRAVDRRFHRSGYDPQAVVDTFSRHLRVQVDLDAIRGELLAAARDSVQPRSAGLWLRRREGEP
jgi:hypothetical protein